MMPPPMMGTYPRRTAAQTALIEKQMMAASIMRNLFSYQPKRPKKKRRSGENN